MEFAFATAGSLDLPVLLSLAPTSAHSMENVIKENATVTKSTVAMIAAS